MAARKAEKASSFCGNKQTSKGANFMDEEYTGLVKTKEANSVSKQSTLSPKG